MHKLIASNIKVMATRTILFYKSLVVYRNSFARTNDTKKTEFLEVHFLCFKGTNLSQKSGNYTFLFKPKEVYPSEGSTREKLLLQQIHTWVKTNHHFCCPSQSLREILPHQKEIAELTAYIHFTQNFQRTFPFCCKG